MFNKHSQGGNIGKPKDPHRLPLPDAHLTFPRFVSPTEVNHDIFGFLQIFLQHVTTSSDKSCESIEEMDGHWDWANLKINKLKILLQEKCYGKSHNLRLCVLESLKWTTCRWRIPRFWNRCSRAGFLLLSEQYGIFSNTLIGYTATPKTWVKWFL